MAAAWRAAAAFALPCSAGAQALRSYVVTGDGIAESLTGTPGDAARGRALVLERTSTCILCHSGPFPEATFQGDLAPSYAFSLSGIYQPRDSTFAETEGGGTSPLDAPREVRQREADNAQAWYKTITVDTFGQG